MTIEINRRDAVRVLAASGAAAISAVRQHQAKEKNMSAPIDAFVHRLHRSQRLGLGQF